MIANILIFKSKDDIGLREKVEETHCIYVTSNGVKRIYTSLTVLKL